MSGKDLLTLIGLAVGVASSWFFAKGVLALRDEVMVGLASAFHGPNPQIIRSFKEQRTQYAVGFVLLSFSFACQFAATLLPQDAAGSEWFGKWSSAGVAVGVALVLMALGTLAERYVMKTG